MIKTTIIVILILLLIITLYSYYCLSSRMVEFERARLEFILAKENEVNDLEKKVKVVSDCSNKNEKYQDAIKEINNIIEKINLPPGSICSKYHNNNDKQIISNIKNIVDNPSIPELITNTNIETNMNNSIHSEYIVNPQLIMPVLSEISYKGESENNPNKTIEHFNVKNIISKLLYTNNSN